MAVDSDTGTLVAGERHRLADTLHAGLVQRVTALSLAVDNALLHDARGDSAAVGAALRVLRTHADEAIEDCRALIDELRAPTDA
ncbi:MAG: hypothetical protein KY460_03865 [Actinobacteria bacterium]|nr:hypothetical protein [Actinomycetota bacterium]